MGRRKAAQPVLHRCVGCEEELGVTRISREIGWACESCAEVVEPESLPTKEQWFKRERAISAIRDRK